MAGILAKISEKYSELWKAIIRPPRDIYTLSDLGPNRFRIDSKVYQRSDFIIRNSKSLSIYCSHFEPIGRERVSDVLPCVIYLHGNSSSRREALPILPLLLPLNITVFAMDMTGSGHSDGKYISLGWHERDDLFSAIKHLRETSTVGNIAVWGRSMGAATALMHGYRDPTISGIIADSPFSSLRQLCHELVHLYLPLLPRFLVDSALSVIESSIFHRISVNVDDLSPISYVAKSYVPCMFVCGNSDSFIPPHHSRMLYEKYGGEKYFLIVPGDHNSERPKYLKNSAAIFFYNVLKCDELCNSKEGIMCLTGLEIEKYSKSNSFAGISEYIQKNQHQLEAI